MSIPQVWTISTHQDCFDEVISSVQCRVCLSEHVTNKDRSFFESLKEAGNPL